MDTQLAISLARQISVAYEPSFITSPEETARAGCERLGLQFLDYATGVDQDERVPYAIISADQDNQISVAFRGTEIGRVIGIREWEEDLDGLLESCTFMPAAKWHRGMGKLYNSLQTSSGLPLAEALKASSPIIGGHSLGGFQATALGAHLGSLAHSVYTFNSGRMFDAVGCGLMDSSVLTYRYVVRGEPVHYLPPELLGYRYSGIEVDLDPKGRVSPTPRVLHILNTVQFLLGDSTVQIDPSSLP